MNITELSDILKNMYENATNNKAAMIHLFGIKYAKELKNDDISIKELTKAAHIPESYVVEINKGIRPSEYVEVKEKYR